MPRKEGKISAPHISILCPILNVRPYIAEMIESVLAQSYPHWELIIMDGKSSDGTIDVIQTYAKRDGRIRVYSEPDESSWHAVDKGLDLSRGEFIAIVCGQDGFLDREWLRKCDRVFSDDPQVSLVWGLGRGIREDGTPFFETDAYSHFLHSESVSQISSNIVKKFLRTTGELITAKWERKKFLVRKIFTPNAVFIINTLAERNFPGGKIPQKEDWFDYWLKTAMVFPDQSMCVSKRVFLDCVPRYEPGSRTLGYMTEFFLNFNTKGYLAYFIPTYAVFTRMHPGSSGERGSHELEYKVQEYFRNVRRFRERLFKNNELFKFVDRYGGVVSTRKF